MSNKVKKLVKEEYNKLKKVFEKIINPGNEKAMPQPALQPYRPRKNF